MMPITYLTVSDVMVIHQRMISEFGGDPGLRDRGLLESAVSMPRATFGGVQLHENISDMAAAYHFHLCKNHPFIDGNKRVAVAVAEILLLINGNELVASDQELEQLTMDVASGVLSKDEVLAFFAKHVVPAS
jgi:death-on-curing protein